MPKIESNGIQLYYELKGAGQTLVFIHGLGSSTRDWEFQVLEFSKNYRVLTYDLRGHGKSDKPSGPYTIPMFAADAAALLGSLGTGPAHIVGISLGGGIAIQVALDSPSLVKTLTIVNSGPSMGGTAEQRKKEIDSRVAVVQQMGMPAMGQALAPRLFPNPDHVGLIETFIARWAENDPRAYCDATISLMNFDATDRISAIQCPTLVIAADQDYTPTAAKEEFVKLMPHAELVVIPNSHHATPIERPEAFNAALKQFLNKYNQA